MWFHKGFNLRPAFRHLKEELVNCSNINLTRNNSLSILFSWLKLSILVKIWTLLPVRLSISNLLRITKLPKTIKLTWQLRIKPCHFSMVESLMSLQQVLQVKFTLWEIINSIISSCNKWMGLQTHTNPLLALSLMRKKSNKRWRISSRCSNSNNKGKTNLKSLNLRTFQ